MSTFRLAKDVLDPAVSDPDNCFGSRHVSCFAIPMKTTAGRFSGLANSVSDVLHFIELGRLTPDPKTPSALNKSGCLEHDMQRLAAPMDNPMIARVGLLAVVRYFSLDKGHYLFQQVVLEHVVIAALSRSRSRPERQRVTIRHHDNHRHRFLFRQQIVENQVGNTAIVQPAARSLLPCK